MSFLKRLAQGIRKRLQLPTSYSYQVQYPILMPLQRLYKRVYELTTSNKYKLYRVLKETDSELYGAIDRLSRMVRHAYGGFVLHVGKSLDDRERALLEELQRFERQWDVASIFQSSADRLCTYGDDVSLVTFQNGLKEWRPLPMEAVTVVESRKQIGNMSSQVFEPKLYVLNELNEQLRQIFPADRIIHISLNNRAQPVYDILGRYTFGVWSLSPLEPLKYDLLWKIAVKINDIILRQKLVPRMHHKLDLSMFDPDEYSGDTKEARIQAARSGARSFLSDYVKDIATSLKEVDKDFVTSKDVEIDYVEPKRVSYVDPNPMIEQLNRSIYAVIGPVESAVTGRGARSYASEIAVSSYAILVAETIAKTIKQKILGVVRRHIQTKFGKEYEDLLDKIDIKVRLAYGIQYGELIRQVAVLTATNLFTVDELREILGYEPLTDEQRDEIATRIGRGRIGQHAQTMDDILRDYIRRKEPQETITPESRRDKQET